MRSCASSGSVAPLSDIFNPGGDDDDKGRSAAAANDNDDDDDDESGPKDDGASEGCTAAAADEPVGEPTTLEVGELRPGQAFMGAGELAHEGGAIAEDSQIITPLAPTDGVQGIDVSRWQGEINWTSVRNAGIQFAWIKATEGTTYKDDQFNANYVNAYNAGVIRGAYHFATPDTSAAERPSRSAHASMPRDVTRPSTLCTRCSIGSSAERAWG